MQGKIGTTELQQLIDRVIQLETRQLVRAMIQVRTQSPEIYRQIGEYMRNRIVSGSDSSRAIAT